MSHSYYLGGYNLQLSSFPLVLKPSDLPCIEIKKLISSGNYHSLEKVPNEPVYLSYVDNALTIHAQGLKESLSLSINFSEGKSKHRRLYGGGKKQPLAKSCGLDKHPKWTILDATAGLGRDAFVLASLGANITLCEQHPALFGLLMDAVDRAKADGEAVVIVERMSCFHQDSIHYLKAVLAGNYPVPDVIYLDPMYPERKKAASIKKEMQILQSLVGHTMDQAELLTLALHVAKHRVVVKRPKSAKAISEQAVSYTVSSVNTRYDVYVC